MKTQVAIVGAGPAGLFLAHLLKRQGIESVVLEARSREHVEARVRAGVLEAGTIDTLNRLGLGERMAREGLVDKGLDIRFSRTPDPHGLPVPDRPQRLHLRTAGGREGSGCCPPGGRRPAALRGGSRASRKARDVVAAPALPPSGNGQQLDCVFVAGCDGFHGISRASVPESAITNYVRRYDFAWLGILVKAPPLPDMTYANHDRGFALCSRRSRSVSRWYLQVPSPTGQRTGPTRRSGTVARAHVRRTRCGGKEERSSQRDIGATARFHASPMQYGNLYMAGDAVHIVPPTRRERR